LMVNFWHFCDSQDFFTLRRCEILQRFLGAAAKSLVDSFWMGRLFK
jgi:hypothetical protein